MAYLALYRKYRPKSFDKLIGQEHIVTTLTNQIKQDKIGHAYLFTGTRGTGKTSTAKMFAHAINCEQPINGSFCGKCPTCLALNDASNLDIIEMDAASNNGVEEIRALREKISYAPSAGKYKVYIIDEVHMLTTQAFNALLKTLEEPPKHAVFILATTEVQKVPQTILSRCMRFDFKLVPTNQIENLIKEIYNNEGKEYEDEAIKLIAKAGEGSVRDSLSIADTCLSFEKGKLTYQSVLNILGTTDYSEVLSIIKDMLESQAGSMLAKLEHLLAQGKQVGLLLANINSCLRDLLIVKTCKDANKILGLPTDRYNELASMLVCINAERLSRALSVLTKLDNDMRYATNQKIVLENALLTCARVDADYSIDALLARIKALEDKIESGININCKPQIIQQKPLNSYNVLQFMGELYGKLRSSSHILLWQVLQKAQAQIIENNLVLTFSDNVTMQIVTDEQKEVIKSLCPEVIPFEIVLKCDERKDEVEKFDNAIKELKDNFGAEMIVERKINKGDK